jgi:hypothetical protein
MKKKRLVYLLFLFILIQSCSKEELNDDNIKLISYHNYGDVISRTTTYEYNTDGLVEEEVSIKRKSKNDSIIAIYKQKNTYQNNLLLQRDFYTDDIHFRTAFYNYKDGKIQSIMYESDEYNVQRNSKDEITYDANGRITEKSWTTNVYYLDKDSTYHYQGKNEYYYLSDEKILIRRLTSSSVIEDLYQINKDSFSPFCLIRTEAENKLSPFNCNNIVNSIRTQRNTNGEVIYYYESTYDYKNNKYSYPVEIIQKNINDNSTDTYHSIYKYNK